MAVAPLLLILNDGLGQQQPVLFWPSREPMVFLIAVVFAPITEEWIFRGWLWRWLAQRFPQDAPDKGTRDSLLVASFVSPTNLSSTVLFALLHGLTRGPETALLVIVPSLYLGAIRHQGGHWLICAMVHAIWNYCWFAKSI